MRINPDQKVLKTVATRYNIFENSRKYSGNRRKFVLESVTEAVNDPNTQERISLREHVGYLSHKPRMLANKMELEYTEPISLPDGSTQMMECIPSNYTTKMSIDGQGNLFHEQAILETHTGKQVLALYQSGQGAFSIAASADRGKNPEDGKTYVGSIYGFDWVGRPERPLSWIVESAHPLVSSQISDTLKAQGFSEQDIVECLDQWKHQDGYNQQFQRKRENAERDVFEALLQEENERLQQKIQINQEMIVESLQKQFPHLASFPQAVLEAFAQPGQQRSIEIISGFFESISTLDLSQLPLGNQPKETVPAYEKIIEPYTEKTDDFFHVANAVDTTK